MTRLLGTSGLTCENLERIHGVWHHVHSVRFYDGHVVSVDTPDPIWVASLAKASDRERSDSDCALLTHNGHETHAIPLALLDGDNCKLCGGRLKRAALAIDERRVGQAVNHRVTNGIKDA